MNKPGPKPKNNYVCKCCDPPHSFNTSSNKAQHEYRQRNKKSKTEIGSILGERDIEVKDLDDFKISLKAHKKNIFALGDTGAFSKFK